ncbi:5-hydroxyisourate hydrolase [Bacillus fengqiuensis]|nr:5-hydroxyisourate hydrolase [Bacillus fengqiuensis]
MTGLTTHILDLTHGMPAANVTIQLSKFEGSTPFLLKTAMTNDDGRLNEPLLSTDEMKTGEYELLFNIGDYFREKSVTLPEPAFLDKVSIRFGIADPRSHYHVPLLISPWGYQIYRGS